MDNLSLFSALNALQTGLHDNPLWDDDLRTLYRARRAEYLSAPRGRPRFVLGLAALLERLAARLRRTADAPAPRLWHA